MGASREAIATKKTTAPLVRHGVCDTFGESGTPEALYRKYQLDSEGIALIVAKALND